MGSNKSQDPNDLEHYDVHQSPFLELQNPFTTWEAFKMVLLLPLLIPRVLIGILACLLLACISFCVAYGQDISKPFSPFRRRLVELSRYNCSVVLAMLGVRMRVQGWENVAKAKKLGAIILFNHISWIDSIVMLRLFAPSGVAKASLADLPLFGTCIKSFQNIYVPRNTLETRKQVAGTSSSVSQMIRERCAHMRDRPEDPQYPMLCMAPEGTCGDGRCILQFRTGAFVPGMPVLPVLLQYEKKHHNPAWTIIYELWHFVRLVCQFRNGLDVRILPPVDPSKAQQDDPVQYAEDVRALYAKTLGLPLVEQGHLHFISLVKAGVRVSWDGRRVTAPEGILDGRGFAAIVKRAKKTE